MPSSLTKEGDAHGYNGSFNTFACNFCGSYLFKRIGTIKNKHPHRPK